jgi:hypothetical protein
MVGFRFKRITIVPPYCGTPRLSHQCPVAAEVDTEVVPNDELLVFGAVEVVVLGVVAVVAEVLLVVTAVVVDDVLHEAKIMEKTNAPHKIKNAIFPFILSPFFSSYRKCIIQLWEKAFTLLPG